MNTDTTIHTTAKPAEGSVLQFTPATGYVVDLYWRKPGSTPNESWSCPLIGWAVVVGADRCDPQTYSTTYDPQTYSTTLAAVFVDASGFVKTTYGEVSMARREHGTIFWSVRLGSVEQEEASC